MEIYASYIFFRFLDLNDIKTVKMSLTAIRPKLFLTAVYHLPFSNTEIGFFILFTKLKETNKSKECHFPHVTHHIVQIFIMSMDILLIFIGVF